VSGPEFTREQLAAASRAYGKGSMRSDLAEFCIQLLDERDAAYSALRSCVTQVDQPKRHLPVLRAAGWKGGR
jgi:hypothetical protein